MSNETILVKPSDLPKTFEFKTTPGGYVFFLGIGYIILAVGVLSLIFAPSTLTYYGSLTFFQIVYMHPGPVVSIGILLVGASTQIAATRTTNKVKEILEGHQLDPDANVPPNACLSIEQGDDKLFLVMAIHETEEETELA